MIEQKYSSMNTSINHIPATFKKVEKLFGWESGTFNFDIGAGKAFNGVHKFSEALLEIGVMNITYDPFHYSYDHNEAALLAAKTQVISTCTVNNVLNVIVEYENRFQVIKLAYDTLCDSGTAYFLIYEGNKSGNGVSSKDDCWQSNNRASFYVEEIAQVFPKVVRKDCLIIAYKNA